MWTAWIPLGECPQLQGSLAYYGGRARDQLVQFRPFQTAAHSKRALKHHAHQTGRLAVLIEAEFDGIDDAIER